MANVKDGWHAVYEARVYVENGKITDIMDVYGYHHCAIYKRDEVEREDYNRLNTDEWKGMKFTTFRSGMAKGVYLIQRIEDGNIQMEQESE